MVKISFEAKPMNYPADRRGIETKAVPTLSFRLVRSPFAEESESACVRKNWSDRTIKKTTSTAKHRGIFCLNICAPEFEESVLFFAASL